MNHGKKLILLGLALISTIPAYAQGRFSPRAELDGYVGTVNNVFSDNGTKLASVTWDINNLTAVYKLKELNLGVARIGKLKKGTRVVYDGYVGTVIELFRNDHRKLARVQWDVNKLTGIYNANELAIEVK